MMQSSRLGMSPAQYQKIRAWFEARPAALRALRALDRGLPWVTAASYGVLLAVLGARWAATAQDMQQLARAVLVPAAAFLGCGWLRRVLDCPRPYQQPGFEALVPKKTRGRSFPSRHAVSGAVIAMAWLPVCPLWAAVLAAVDAAICAERVVAGVHTAGDVLAGAALGFAVGCLCL